MKSNDRTWRLPLKGFMDLLVKQNELNTMIIKKHNLKMSYEEMVDNQKLAFIVELAEYANETRVFKYWSVKEASERTIVLEEYVDGLHFVLSLGLLKGFGQDRLPDFAITVEQETYSKHQITSQMIDVVYYAITYDYTTLLKEFLRLGFMWGFSWDEIVDAYNKKYEENIKRQESGTY